MSGLDIEAIRNRARIAASVADALPPIGQEAVAATVDAVGALADALGAAQDEARNAEFEVVRLRGELAGANAEVGKLREWNDEIKAERDALAEAAIQHEADLRDARAATADALQVIADLRGGTP